MKRRTFIAGLTAASLGTIGGCLSDAGGQSDDVRLGWYNVGNFDTEPHRFGMRVERDGEQVHQSSHMVQGRTDPDRASETATIYSATAECTWEDTPGEYTVSVRVDGDEWVKNRLSDSDSTAPCLAARAEFDNSSLASGEFAFWTRSCRDVDRFTGGCEFAEASGTRTD